MYKLTRSDSPFDVLETTFAYLSLPPATMVLAMPNNDEPPVLMAFDEVRRVLADPATTFEDKDRILNALVARAKAERGDWMVALCGVLLPGLRNAIAPLGRVFAHVADDLEGEALVGLLRAIDAADVPISRPAARLVWGARNHLYTWLSTESPSAHQASRIVEDEPVEPIEMDPLDERFHSHTPRAPWGHPDFVLAEAVKAGVIDAQDAELIAVTRMERVSLYAAADALGISHNAVKNRRWAAEAKLIDWIGRKFLTPRPSLSGMGSTGRPRSGRHGIGELQRCQPNSSTSAKEVTTPTAIPGIHARSAHPSTTAP